MTELSIGIHHDVPFDTYASWPAINFSTLKWAAVSPEHLKAALDGEIEDDDTKSRKFGRAVHCRLLEPERFRQEFLVANPCQGILQSGDNRGEVCGKVSSRYDPEEGWFCGIHGKKLSEPTDYISESDAASIERIAEKVAKHDVIRLFKQTGGFEASIVWEPRPGIVGKARLDKLINTDKIKGVVDIKKSTLGKGGIHEFQKALMNYKYYAQAYWYTAAAKQQLGLDHTPFFWFVVIEEQYPHSISVFQVDSEVLKAGEDACNLWLDRYEAAMKSGEWVGYGADIQMIGLPAWYTRP